MIKPILKFIEKHWHTHPAEFRPELKYEDIAKIPLAEAIERVEWCIDTPMLYSNQPVKDDQCWWRVRTAALIGDHVIKLREQEGREAMHKWVDSLFDQGGTTTK